jgi:hypothetical protein
MQECSLTQTLVELRLWLSLVSTKRGGYDCSILTTCKHFEQLITILNTETPANVNF